MREHVYEIQTTNGPFRFCCENLTMANDHVDTLHISDFFSAEIKDGPMFLGVLNRDFTECDLGFWEDEDD